MCDLTKAIYNDAEEARKHLEAIRWPNGPFCPHCGETENVKPLHGKSHRPGLHKCYSCNGHFTVTVGTVFERSKIPLNKWVLASHLFASSKKGMSAHQLHRMLGITYKSAWFMLHRLREAATDNGNDQMGGPGKVVEVDETFIGHDRTIKPKGEKKGRGYHHKYKVLTLVERGGRARSFHVPSVTAKTLRPILDEQLHAASTVYTDEAGQYTLTNPPMFQNHDYVAHNISEYVRGDVHTNSIEGYFSIFKRGMKGIYQHCSKAHLKRYLAEFDFRFNYRSKLGYSDSDRARMLLASIGGKRLQYA
jgi:transposase-like protein